MKGTEKQVAWAKDILSVSDWNDAVSDYRQEIVAKIESFESRGKQDVANKNKAKLEKIDRVTEYLADTSEIPSEMIIENRGIFNFSGIEDRAELARKAGRVCDLLDIDAY